MKTLPAKAVKPVRERRGLPIADWPEGDRLAWADSCRPGHRLDPGGNASYLAPESQQDFACPYGLFLGFLKRSGRLDYAAPAASQVTPENVEAYLAEVKARVSSVTAYNRIYKLRRGAELIAPNMDFKWLAEIEKDLEFVMVPKSKFDRFVLTDVAVEAGLTLITEAQQSAKTELARAIGIRNGLMLTVLALYPNRRKNFATLALGQTFQQIRSDWWITLPSESTKSRRADERRIHEWLKPYVEAYLNEARPVLLRISGQPTNALWISSTKGYQMTTGKVGSLISQITLETLGVSISPHLFRTAAATSAATYASEMPHLGSALLDHTDPRVTEERYVRTSSIGAAQAYAQLIRSRRKR